MKYFKSFLTIFISLFFMSISTFPVYSMTNGFDVEPLTVTESKKIISSITFERFNVEPTNDSIECFDVNENGEIAIGSESHSSKIISIYSTDGVFLYALEFETEGGFGLEWQDNGLNVYFVRGAIGINIDPQGNILDVFAIKDTMENNSYWNNVVFSSTRNVNGTVYKIDNDLGIFNFVQSSYSRLVKISPNGEKIVLYDVGNSQLFYTLLWTGVILIGIVSIITIILKQWKKNLEDMKKQERTFQELLEQVNEGNKNQK